MLPATTRYSAYGDTRNKKTSFNFFPGEGERERRVDLEIPTLVHMMYKKYEGKITITCSQNTGKICRSCPHYIKVGRAFFLKIGDKFNEF